MLGHEPGHAGVMRQRLSLVTLGVADVGRARAFYEALGWRGVGGSGDEPVFFQAGDMVVALWDRSLLAADTGVEDNGGWGGITLAHNVGSRREVDEITEAARAAGAIVTREPAEAFWGGYTSMVIDPDGHPWEIAHNPGWDLDEEGGVHLR
jgi:catechol 2,3-dioxygenase-like lactoylglutathione lyase family enzyme